MSQNQESITRNLKILFIDGCFPPWPYEKSGGAQRSALIYQALTELGSVDRFVLSAIMFNTQKTESFADIEKYNLIDTFSSSLYSTVDSLNSQNRFMKFLNIHTGHYKTNKQCHIKIKSFLQNKQYDLIFIRYLRQACVSGCFNLKEKIPIFLDFDDLDFLRFRTQIQSKKRTFLRSLGLLYVENRLRLFGKKAAKNCSHSWVASPEDTKMCKDWPNVSVLPNIPYCQFANQSKEITSSLFSSNRILFLGSLSWLANIEGIQHFLNNIWPMIIDKIPNIQLDLVGAGLSDNLKSLFRKIRNVNSIGFVEDISEFYESSALTIAPIYWGSGTKIKVLESFFYKRVCVCTPHALAGIDLPKKLKSKIMCQSDEEMADTCVQFIQHTKERVEMESILKEQIDQGFSYQSFKNEIHSKIQKHLPFDNSTKR